MLTTGVPGCRRDREARRFMKNMLRRLRSIIGRGHPRLHWLTDDIAFSAAPGAESWERVREVGIACVLDLRSESPDARQEVEAAGRSATER
jgi:hypothetical protein